MYKPPASKQTSIRLSGAALVVIIRIIECSEKNLLFITFLLIVVVNLRRGVGDRACSSHFIQPQRGNGAGKESVNSVGVARLPVTRRRTGKKALFTPVSRILVRGLRGTSGGIVKTL
jgi:hypothetical protein